MDRNGPQMDRKNDKTLITSVELSSKIYKIIHIQDKIINRKESNILILTLI